MKINMAGLIRVYVLVTTLNVLIFSSLYISIPQLRTSFVAEDQFTESVTAVLFFSSFLLGLILIVKLKRKSYRKVYLVIPLLGLVGFLDELSFGQRMFNLTMPKIYGVEIDAVHDFAELAYKVFINHSTYVLAVSALGVFCIVLFLIILKHHKYLDRIPDVIKRYPPFVFVLSFIAFIFIALIYDLHTLIPRRGFFLFIFEELSELNAALALLFASFSIAHNNTI